MSRTSYLSNLLVTAMVVSLPFGGILFWSIDAHSVPVGPAEAASARLEVSGTESEKVEHILEYIKAEASGNAKKTLVLEKSSKFYSRVKDYYLSEYLIKPSTASGVAAISKIGTTFTSLPSGGDKWEEDALTWNHLPIPSTLRFIRPDLPETIAGATDIISQSNRKILPLIDISQLLGDINVGTDRNADVTGGGRNVSQLLHWGTGVKYSHLKPDALRELFIGYEIYHLEGWDVFAEDPINDLIAEEAGRILGGQLRLGKVTSANLHAVLQDSFSEARAWVGSLLRMRQAELDTWIKAETQTPAMFWYEFPTEIWGTKTIVGAIRDRKKLDEIKRWNLTQKIVGIYTLIYEADEWEKKHGAIANTALIRGLVAGTYTDQIKLAVKQSKLPLEEKLKQGGSIALPSRTRIFSF